MCFLLDGTSASSLISSKDASNRQPKTPPGPGAVQRLSHMAHELQFQGFAKRLFHEQK